MALNHSPSIVTNGLILYLDAANRRSYPGSGTVWFDISGNNNHGTINGPTFSNDEKNGFVFSGVNGNNISITHSDTLMPSQAINLSAWIKCNTLLSLMSNHAGLIAKENYSIQNGYYLAFRTDVAGDPLTFRINGSATQSHINWYNTGYFNDLKWHCVVANFNKSSMSVYIDSTLVASAPYTANITANTNNITIGNVFNGCIDCVKIYNRALSQQEIAQNYHATKARFGL